MPRPLISAALILLVTAPAGGADRPVEVRVRPAAADGLWRLTYRLSEPAARLTFVRRRTLGRVPAWRVETPGYRLSSHEGKDVIEAGRAARPRRQITIAFPVDTRHPEKDYQLFERFSDGSLLLYTGHLVVAPGPGSAEEVVPPHRFVLEPRRGEHLIVDGRLHRRRATWVDPGQDGTFIYYGRRRPRESAHVLAVLDPALPGWMAAAVGEALPVLFRDYMELTGFALDSRPTLFLSFRPVTGDTTSWKGGTLTRLIQMHVEAGPGAARDHSFHRRLLKFLAHEAAHLWNGQLFRSEGQHQSWMHEGGADAFAWRALRRAGVLDDAGLEDAQAEDLNGCLAALGPEPLQQAERRGDFRPVYTCGSALAWLTEAAWRRAHPATDLHAFWSSLFRKATSRGRGYDEALYLDVLREGRVDEATIAFIEAFLYRPMPDRVSRTRAAFAAAGVVLRPRPDAMTAGARQDWGDRALAALMKGDCRGRYSVTRQKGSFLMKGSAACATLREPLQVDRLEGRALGREGDAAYDALAARCAAGESVALGIRDRQEPLRVPCSAELPPRPPWLAVARE